MKYKIKKRRRNIAEEFKNKSEDMNLHNIYNRYDICLSSYFTPITCVIDVISFQEFLILQAIFIL